jgi:hypothetical protein
MSVAIVLACLVALAPPLAAQPRDMVGVVTEIRPGRGRVEVKAAGADWRPAAPLLALRAGDVIRATDDAVAVVVLGSGRGARRIDAASSPVVLEAAAPGDGTARKALALIEKSLDFLSLTTKEAPRGLLATRGPAPPPTVLTPRRTLVRQAAVTFEWVGGARSRYTVRLTGPGGVVFERAVVGSRLTYPDGAPALAPGARYAVDVIAEGQRPERAAFEVLGAERAQEIARDLAELEAIGPGASPTSTAVVRAGYLAEQGLFHEAREVVVLALRADPEQAALHLLLGNIYDRTGLPSQAGLAFAEAEWLATEKRR